MLFGVIFVLLSLLFKLKQINYLGWCLGKAGMIYCFSPWALHKCNLPRLGDSNRYSQHKIVWKKNKINHKSIINYTIDKL